MSVMAFETNHVFYCSAAILGRQQKEIWKLHITDLLGGVPTDDQLISSQRTINAENVFTSNAMINQQELSRNAIVGDKSVTTDLAWMVSEECCECPPKCYHYVYEVGMR